jgi:hypothetical protein
MKYQEGSKTHVDYARVPQAAPVQLAEKLGNAIAHISRTPKIGGPLAL